MVLSSSLVISPLRAVTFLITSVVVMFATFPMRPSGVMFILIVDAVASLPVLALVEVAVAAVLVDVDAAKMVVDDIAAAIDVVAIEVLVMSTDMVVVSLSSMMVSRTER